MFEVSIPGSVMLFGEHAVLHGKMALVAAIEDRLQIKLEPNNDNIININSCFGNINIKLNDLNYIDLNQADHQFVLASIKQFNLQHNITKGFNVIIDNKNLKNSIGFGSSAAVVVGVLALLNRFFLLNKNLNKNLFSQALATVHMVQNGLGSGADIAASIHGGIVSIKNYIIQEILINNFDLTAVYCGYKTKTKDVIIIINNKIINNNILYNSIFNSMQEYSELAVIAIKQNNLHMLGQLMNISHGLMQGLEVVDANLDQLACSLRKENNILGAKVSGSGLGDCVIGLGRLNNQLFNNNQFDLSIATEGIKWLQ